MEIMEAIANVDTDYETERGKPMPSLNHAIIQKNLVVRLDVKYGHLYSVLPEIKIEMEPKDRVPDIGLYPLQEFVPENDEIKMSEAPLGVVEILSPTQDLTGLISKSAQYFQKGAKSYWLVLPALRSIYVFSEPGEYANFTYRDVLKDEKLGIELDLKEIFK
jgi:Uma2 family endonuclease